MMSVDRTGWSRTIVVALVALVVGVVAGWWMRSAIVSPGNFAGASAPQPVAVAAPPASAVGTGGRVLAPPSARDARTLSDLEGRKLQLPIDGADVSKLRGSFDEFHNGHRHEAVDILAPRGTPILAVDDGTIAKIFESKAGGHTIYQFDPTRRYCYYYAHLDHYAENLHEGDIVARGQVIGYVGTSGDAPANTPHLHFTIFELGPEQHWWEGRPIDPYLVFSR